VNAYLAEGGRAVAVEAGQAYVDVGTLNGYRTALRLLDERAGTPPEDPAPIPRPRLTREHIERRVRELGPWFHNLELGGVATAPEHFLADYPNQKWQRFRDAIPADLTGKSVLDIGCNAGFYAMQMKRRGAARVLGIDSDERYLAQARFAAEVSGLDIELRRLSVYDLGALGERFDVVLFMGVLYHLRHPLLALDLIHANVARDLLVFQSMQRGSRELEPVAPDHDFAEVDHFDRPGYPRLHFVEHRYAHDETNWWVPNRACAEAMLRSSGFDIVAHPEDEVYVCRRRDLEPAPDGPAAVYPARPRAARR
jgi:tRNA (mo5U34)-methyltransferase